MESAIGGIDRVFDSRDVITEVSPNDAMYRGDPEWYFQLGASAVENIGLGMLATRHTGFLRILDMASGHGRVLRALKAAFPGAHLTACDIDEDGVDFCARVLGATPVVSREDPVEIDLDGPYDLIWCGSLLTHFDADRWPGFLSLFASQLSDFGLLVFTTHGRFIAEQAIRGRTFGLAEYAVGALLSAYRRKGFGFAAYEGELADRVGTSGSYGISLSSPGWVFEQVQGEPGMLVVSYAERSWGGHDVVICMREPAPGLGAERVMPDPALT